MPTGESEYRDIISWKNKQKNQCEMERDGGNKKGRTGQSRGWTDEMRVEQVSAVLHFCVMAL